MGKGFFMAVLNLANKPATSEVTEHKCVFDHGHEGSYYGPIWGGNGSPAAQYAGVSAIPAFGQPLQYVEAIGIGLCAFEQSYLQVAMGPSAGNYDSFVRFNIQTNIIPVNVVQSSGNIVCSCSLNSSANIWSGQAAVGIMRLPSPDSVHDFNSYVQPDNADWMGKLQDQSKGRFFQRPLFRASFPASHDSGMSCVTRATPFGNASNTRTQTLDIGGQLSAGIRYFDLRPAVWDITASIGPNDFYYGHFASNLGGQGCLGQNLVASLQQVNQFLAAHPRELVVLKFSHYQDSSTKPFPVSLQKELVATVQTQLGSNMYLAGSNTEKTNHQTIQDLLDSGRRAICVFDSLDASLIDPMQGVLLFGDLSGSPNADSNFDVYDSYADSDNLVHMIRDQIGKWKEFCARPQYCSGMFLFSFTLTMGGEWDNILAEFGYKSILELASYANEYLWNVINCIYRGPASDQHPPPNYVYLDDARGDLPVAVAWYLNVQHTD